MFNSVMSLQDSLFLTCLYNHPVPIHVQLTRSLLFKVRLFLMLALLVPFSLSHAALMNTYQSQWSLTLFPVEGESFLYEERHQSDFLSSAITLADHLQLEEIHGFYFSKRPLKNHIKLKLDFFALGNLLRHAAGGYGTHGFRIHESMKGNDLTIPLPASVWLFASGLIGLRLLSKHDKTRRGFSGER